MDSSEKEKAFITLNILTLLSLKSFLFKILFAPIITIAYPEAAFSFSAFKVIV